MNVMNLRPSEIRFSQKKIGNKFQNGMRIAELVDNICHGRVSINSIPQISVAKVGSKWFAADNRRLWVFKQLEARGKCQHIPVREIGAIPPNKMTTENGGVSVKVRGNPNMCRTPRHRKSPYCDYADDGDDFYDDSDYDNTAYYDNDDCNDSNDDIDDYSTGDDDFSIDKPLMYF